MKEIVNFFNKYLGWRNWAVLVYNSVFENMFVIFYIALRQQIDPLLFITNVFIFLLFSSFCTTYGYLINDYGDIELDILHGKNNTFQNDTKAKANLVILSFLLAIIVCGLPFWKNFLFLPIWLAWFIISTAYSIQPTRLKERGKTGLFFVVMAQRVLPTLIIFTAFRYYDIVDIICFTIYIFFRGLSSDVNHQLGDYKNDLLTGTETYVVQTGYTKAQKIFRFSLELEKILLGLCLLLMSAKLSYLEIKGMPLLLPIIIFYFTVYGVSLIKVFQRNNIDVNPFVPNRKNIFQFIHHAFPSVLLSFYLLVVLSFNEPLFLIILICFIIYRKMYSIDSIINSFPVRFIRNITGSH